MREDEIRKAIEGLPPDRFERFGRELVRRELYPGLNPTSPTHDLGEDARSEGSVLFEHHGKWVSVAVSKTATWDKLSGDCNRCKETNRVIDTLVFVTAKDTQTDVEDVWRQDVRRLYGWDLEVRSLRWLAPVASHPKHEQFVDDYLHIPPPGGDYFQDIERSFAICTERRLERINNRITGLKDPVDRRELISIEDQLAQGHPVVLSGDAGTGKSGIGAALAIAAKTGERPALLLDARDIGHIRDEMDLRHFLGLHGPVSDTIERLSREKGCRIIIDQLDYVVGSACAQVLATLLITCAKTPGVECIAIGRKRESHEADLLRRLFAAGFVELTSFLLGDKEVVDVLHSLDILSPPLELIALGRNLLNLDLIGHIKVQNPAFDFSKVTLELDLWEQFLNALRERERRWDDDTKGEHLIGAAINLAGQGLKNSDGQFVLEYPLSSLHKRLESWDIITRLDGRRYRFRHDKLQDFFYAWDASERTLMPLNVIEEIGRFRSRNVLNWMDRLYAQRRSPWRVQFLKEMLNVK